MKTSNNARILYEKLPYSEKGEKLVVKSYKWGFPFYRIFFFVFFFLEKPFNVIDLPVLNKALVEAKQEKIKELSEAKN